ncbi:DUF2963 domain-containing protein [Candidatus Phytoplasma meliae]|uniref:DUF2963 domain-containing protein n=1 Tax=Candidatus Phytoplasma meliae TaxID=1848402 RepID=UPI001B331DA2|nr:DUF2963 domain-containing protein [Candidatus Phytoplasma meliae]
MGFYYFKNNLSSSPHKYQTKTTYYSNGNICTIDEYNQQTGYQTKYTHYHDNGTMDFINEFDPSTGKQIK